MYTCQKIIEHCTHLALDISDILAKDGSKAKQKIQALEASEWFDDSTRILFVEFAVYNPSYNTA